MPKAKTLEYVKLKYWGEHAKKIRAKFGPSPIKVPSKDVDKTIKAMLKIGWVMIAKILPKPECPKCKGTEFTIDRMGGELYVECDGCGKSITNGPSSGNYEITVSQDVWDSIIFGPQNPEYEDEQGDDE